MRFLILAAALVCAAPTAAGPYVGADAQYTFLDYRGLSGFPSQHFGGGGNVHASWRDGHLAIEGGYEWTGTHGVSLSGETVDALLYLRNDGVAPFLTIGGGRMTAKSTRDGFAFDDTGYGWRAGAGVQFRALRLTTRYERLDLPHADYSIVFNLGLEIEP